MNFRYIIENNGVISIVEHNNSSITSTNNQVLTGTIDWAIKYMPLLGIDIERIYIEGYAVKEAKAPLHTVALPDGRTAKIYALPIQGAEKFLRLPVYVDNQLYLLTADESTIMPNGDGEFTYLLKAVKEQGINIFDLMNQFILMRWQEGRFN